MLLSGSLISDMHERTRTCESCDYHMQPIAADDPAKAFKDALLPCAGTTMGLFMLSVLRDPLPLVMMYRANGTGPQATVSRIGIHWCA